jgi:hypothetical protein
MCVIYTSKGMLKKFGVRVIYRKIQYLLTAWSRVFLEKLTGLQLVKKFPHFMEPQGSSPHSQAHATCPYPELAPSSPHTHIPLPEDPSYLSILGNIKGCTP